MYGKIFTSIYDGTLYGHWQALVTFQQMIVLCDLDGVVDMTPHALAARTSIPLKVIEAGIGFLEQPDPYSRSEGCDGRRIERLDEHRPWGWRIVNHGHYRDLTDSETLRAQNRERQRRFRERKALNEKECNDSSRIITDGNAQSRHTDNRLQITDTKEKTLMSGKPDVPLLNGRELKAKAREVLDFLNTKTGRHYRPVAVNLDMIVARLKDGATVTQLRQVVAKKSREWKGDAKMDQYLRPATLFNRMKFEQYVGELGADDGTLS